jgi:FtsP/CotA-like multicopper oxidase with cupredoxin domain
MKKLSRRKFLKYMGAAGAGATLFWHGDILYGLIGGKREALAAIPGGTLDPKTVPKYVTPLVIPPAMPNTGLANNYSIAVKQFTQPILPTGFPVTTVWSYGAANNLGGTLNYPAFSIEATRSNATTVTWINGLVDTSGNYLPHLLPVDQTLHWANPPGGVNGRDTRPTFTTTPGPYTGPVPIVTHVHGMERVPDWSDGYAEAWYLPNAGNLPGGYATKGTWYDFFNIKSGLIWVPGTATFVYPNSQRPSTAWYHDHTLGMTRLNVYAGPAGFYIIRSNNPADNPTVAGGGAAVLPSPAPQLGDAPGTRYYEIPLAIQDRSFDLGGALFYPNSRAFFDGFLGPYIPTTDVSPIWNPEFFGNHIVVNGKTWPFLDVEPRRYRFRLLNGCQSRFLILNFDDPKVQVWQIGNEGGFLRTPVQLKELLMGPAERADIIVDFTNVKVGKSVVMKNSGPDVPFGGGGFKGSDPQTTGQVMQFNVILPLVGTDTSTPPAQLVMPAVPTITSAGTPRTLAMAEIMAAPPTPPIPVEARLGTFDPAVGLPTGLVPLKWMDAITENPAPGASETWELYNFTADAHPIHIHEVFFEVINRQRLDKATGLPIQVPRPPETWENGQKDTVIAYPGEVTRVKMTFGPGGQFVWHCHIVEHEDNEMMRPYRIGPVQPGQPA